MLPFLLVLVLEDVSGGEILGARLEAAIDEGRDVAVRLTYRIEAPAADRLHFSALEIDGAEIEEFAAYTSETPLPVELEPRSGPKRVGTIGLPRGTTALELRYVVRGGAEPAEDGLRVRLPCAILGLPIEETRTGLFSSTIVLPDGLRVIDSFPSQPIANADGSYRFQLPLVPTFVAFRASSGAPLLTPTRVATAAVIALLAATGIVGVRRMRASGP